MNETVNFKIKAIRLPNKYPEIKFNNEVYLLKDEYTNLAYDLTIGKNIIEIEFLNKSSRDTKLINGQIAEDLAVIIENIDYKGYNLITHWDRISSYIDSNGQEIKNTYGFLAFKGLVKIELNGPIFLFLRDLAIEHGQQ